MKFYFHHFFLIDDITHQENLLFIHSIHIDGIQMYGFLAMAVSLHSK